VLVTKEPLDGKTEIRLQINRNNKAAFEGSVALSQMKRKPEELVSFVFSRVFIPIWLFDHDRNRYCSRS